MLRLNRKTYLEALPVLRTKSRKCFRDAYSLERCVDLHSTINFDLLRHLQLSFAHQDYMEFFAVNLPLRSSSSNDRTWPKGWGNASCLRRLPSLKQLDIDFAPMRRVEINEPESYKAWVRQFRSAVLLSSCQRVLLDCLLSFAKQYIQHVPKVRLTGFIKKSTKSKWDRIFQDERNGVHHHVDLEALVVQPYSAL